MTTTPAPEPVRASLRLTSMRILTRLVALLALLAGSLALTTTTASALSCKDPTAVAGLADHVFTGSISDAHDGTLEVVVKEIWKGGPLHKKVTLGTELDGWWDEMAHGHFPDGYRSTSTWLFMPSDRGGALVVSPCSAWPKTKPWGTDLRPASVMPPLSDEPVKDVAKVVPAVTAQDDDSGPNLLVRGGATVLVIAAATGVFLLVRRRRG